jgi:hypothetical protein
MCHLLRSIRWLTRRSVQNVMRVFLAHYTSDKPGLSTGAQALKLDIRREAAAAVKVVCEEEAIDAR